MSHIGAAGPTPSSNQSCPSEYPRPPLPPTLHAHSLQVVFFLPQLVQILRSDPTDGPIQRTLLGMASRSSLFAHQLMWALKTEEQPPEEAFNPEVKR